MQGVTIAIFIISGLQLRRGEAAAALKATGEAGRTTHTASSRDKVCVLRLLQR
jgi:hypothetical protein